MRSMFQIFLDTFYLEYLIFPEAYSMLLRKFESSKLSRRMGFPEQCIAL